MTSKIVYKLEEMQEIQENLYEKNGGKNFFFKNAQKKEIAKNISENFDLKTLLNQCIYILPTESSNEIYIHYPTIKLFIHDEIYEDIIQHLLNLYDECIIKYGNYKLNINLDGFTISAAERYKMCVYLFSKKYIEKYITYDDNCIEKINIFNTPSVIQHIIKLFKHLFPSNIDHKIVYCSKKDSPSIMKNMGIFI